MLCWVMVASPVVSPENETSPSTMTGEGSIGEPITQGKLTNQNDILINVINFSLTRKFLIEIGGSFYREKTCFLPD